MIDIADDRVEVADTNAVLATTIENADATIENAEDSAQSASGNITCEIDITETVEKLSMNLLEEKKDVVMYDREGHRGLYCGGVIACNDAENENKNKNVNERGELPHGQGTMKYYDHPTVSSYIGGWKSGEWEGQGVVKMMTGDSYSGEHREGFRHGSGTYLWHDQRKYSGMFENDWRHGQGRYTWPDRAVYEGSYIQGIRSGYGKYTDPTSGLSYTGDWKEGKHHGYGVQMTGEGVGSDEANVKAKIYRGFFQDGLTHGYGMEINADGTVYHDGEWEHGKPVHKGTAGEKKASYTSPPPILNSDLDVVENQVVSDANGLSGTYRGILHLSTGLPHGNGTISYHSKSIKNEDSLDYYEGCFERGHYHGKGRIRWKNGDSYEGDYVHGKRQGPGVYKWADGKQYKGQFQNDMRHGKGVFIFGKQSSDWYEGSFVKGKREGQGRFVFGDGSVYDGEWKSGVYHGMGELVNTGGDKYVGMFEGGVLHGWGKEISADGKVLYEGKWIQGQTEAVAKRKASRELAEKKILEAKAALESATYQKKQQRSQMQQKVHEFQEQPHQVPAGIADRSSSLAGLGEWTMSLASSALPFSFYSSPSSSRETPKSSSTLITGKHGNVEQVSRTAVGMKAQLECEAVVDKEVQDADGHLGQYTGLVKVETQKPHGVGRLFYLGGSRIHEGFWVDGMKEGHGRCLFTTQGDFHEGEYHRNVRHGAGRYEWKDGRLFVGHYVNDQRHGKGVFTYRNGDKYDGMFRNGDRNGHGRFDFDGGRYEGEWKAGKYHGQGRLLINSKLLVGYFENGHLVKESDHGDEGVHRCSYNQGDQDDDEEEVEEEEVRGSSAGSMSERSGRSRSTSNPASPDGSHTAYFESTKDTETFDKMETVNADNVYIYQ